MYIHRIVTDITHTYYRHSKKRKEKKIAFFRSHITQSEFNVVDDGHSSVKEDRFLIDYQE